MSAPPGTAPDLSLTTAGRNSADAATAAWKRRKGASRRKVTATMVEEVPLGIVRPRVARFTSEQRIRQAMAR